MFMLFESQLSLATIARVVRQCRRDLELVSPGASSERLERRAYERLLISAITTQVAQSVSSLRCRLILRAWS